LSLRSDGKRFIHLNAGEEELERVEDELWGRIKETENLEFAGLYARVIAHLRGKDLEGAEGFLTAIVEGRSH